ncbi:MAG: hypothetical protein AAF627_07040 [Myxococcota bacterium]
MLLLTAWLTWTLGAADLETPVFHWVSSTASEDLELGRQVELRLLSHTFRRVQAPAGFWTAPLEARVEALKLSQARQPANLWVWVVKDEALFRAFVLAAGGKEIQVVEGGSGPELGAALSLLAEEVERRRQAALVPASPEEAPSRRKKWRLLAELGATGPVAGDEASSFLLMRLTAERRLKALSLGAGVEAWPLLFSGPGGWGVGPHLRVSWALLPYLRVGAGASGVLHQLRVPREFEAPDLSWAVRTAARVETSHGWGAWRFGLAAELGIWPLRSELVAEDQVQNALPRVDGALSVFMGPTL